MPKKLSVAKGIECRNFNTQNDYYLKSDKIANK